MPSDYAVTKVSNLGHKKVPEIQCCDNLKLHTEAEGCTAFVSLGEVVYCDPRVSKCRTSLSSRSLTNLDNTHINFSNLPNFRSN